MRRGAVLHTRSSLAPTLRVAVTLEQCWHRTPGGTALSALRASETLDDFDDVEIVGVAARHRRPPEPDWRPGVPVRSLGLPRLALYEAWHRLFDQDTRVAFANYRKGAAK